MPIFIFVFLPVPFIISSDVKLSLSPTLLPFPIIHIFSNASLNSAESRMSPTNKKLLQLSFNLYATPICLYSSHLASMMTSDVLWVQRTDYRKRINKMKTLKGDKDEGWLQWCRFYTPLSRLKKQLYFSDVMDLQTPPPLSAHTYNLHKLTHQLPYIFDPNTSSIRLILQRTTLRALRRNRKVIE